MDIRQLSYFLTIAKTQNYSHASKILFVSQPALKQSVSKIEEEFNTPLFVYKNHRLNLTDTGRLLVERGEPIVKAFNELIFDLQNANEPKRQEIRVGVTFLTMLQYMDQISRFIRKNPNIDLRIIQEGSMKLQELLVQEKIDIGILSFPQIEHDIIIDPVAVNHSSYSACLVVPKEHPLANREKVTFKDLQGFNIASLSDHFALGEFTKKRCREFGFSNQVILTHDDFEILLHSLDKLDAITILPRELEDLSPVEDLVWIPIHDVNSLYKQGLAYRKNMSTNTDVISKFIEAIRH
ncbi:LysR family transcriptional regulator [Streptococcus pseudoporcinus]|uniref:LysR substrate binding domain protein n=1 Tax=Streptococcus pseudoporcinus LQ 940-04 TaxID=875093 RepID=G5K953_9STRE|nr:LysR family transcriptional regulator [Streptococcus pseudoporcinus]EFR44432.1 LysR substrate binding domain protein [Streptococcus pseudoporcinus SPIN 20026]EHI65737.1 LysR substrate binding domain protein [Streptococcus pseudoporcinus LQ 940-04]VEF93528.1 Transcriptional regulator, LysR family [Streptococcus pseudoporcinus]